MAESALLESFSGPTVDPDHPWLGLHPFADENHRYFFGRTAEVRDIFLRVRENPLTVLYGQSGLGKTSLLGAGLIPKLRVERFRPVRVLLDFGEESVPLVNQVRTALAAACADPGGDVATLIDSWAPLASLWEVSAHETIRPRDLADKPPVLIIDQLEEVFTLTEQETQAAGSRGTEVAELFTQIGDLVENRAPVALQKRFKQDPRLALAYDSSPGPVRVVLSLREDYLAQLERWKSTVPSLMRNRMALRLLTGPQALEAVIRPGRIDGRNLISDRVGEQIVRFVAERANDVPLEEVDAVPPLLSLVCERLNTVRLEAKPPQEEISDELVKSQGTDILQRFYDDSFALLPEAQREIVREYVEDRLVTVGGHRNPVAREDAVAELAREGVSEPDNVLNALIARRLLSPEQRGGIQRLEITHDVLAPLVVRGRKEREERRLRKEAERRTQDAERKQAEAEALVALERRRKNRLRFALVGVTALFIFAVAGFIFDAYFRKKIYAKEMVRAQIHRLMQDGREKLHEEKRLQALVYLTAAYQLAQSIHQPDKYLESLLLEASISLPKELNELKVGAKDRHSNWVSFAQFSPNGATLATTSWDGWVRLWNLKDGTSRLISKESSRAASVNFSPKGDRILVAYWNGLAKIWTLDGDLVATLRDHTGRVNYAAFSPDGSKVVTASDDSTAKLWTPNGELLRTLSDHTDMVKSAVFSLDGASVLTASFDGTFKVWDVASGGLVLTVQPSDQDELNFAQFSPGGQYVATAGMQQGVTLWDIRAGKEIASFQNHGNRINVVAFNHDGSLLLTASDDGAARVWNLSSLQMQMSLERHGKRVLCAEFSPNDTMIVSTGDDGYARVWDAHPRILTVPEIVSVVETEVPWRLDHGQLVLSRSSTP